MPNEYEIGLRRETLFRHHGGVLRFPLWRKDGKPIQGQSWKEYLDSVEIDKEVVVDANAELVIDFNRQEASVTGGTLTFREIRNLYNEIRSYGFDL